jgi:uncharacterized protein (DUF2147 family)
MRTLIGFSAALALATAAGAPALAQEKYQRNDKGEWVYELKDRGLEVKEERKLDQYVSEYKDGRREVKREAKADGSWKEEIKDGPCEIKRERSSSGEYKEERKCG